MRVFLGIGSNIEPVIHIQRVKQALAECYSEVRFSTTYQSEAVGFNGDDFLNLVAEIETEQSLTLLIETLKELEDRLGRVRGGEKFSARHIDIDILVYGNLVSDQPIVLPRPEIRDNAYVLCPLAELAGDLTEPGGNATYAELWQQFDQQSQILTAID